MVERLFGRLDGRTASFAATRDMIERYFPGEYRVIRPGADLLPAPGADGGPPEIVFSAEEERGALRLFLRALRKLPTELDWRATIWLRDPAAAPAVTLSRRLRERVRLAGPADGSEAQHLARADIAVAASAGAAPAPQLVLRALAGGAVPVVARLPQYEEALREGELGLLFEPRDAITLAAQLERLIAEPSLVADFAGRVEAAHGDLEWSRVAGEFEALFEEIAARRHGNGRPHVQGGSTSATSSTSTCTCTPTTRPTAPRRWTRCSTRRSGSASARSRSPTTTRSRARSRRASAPTGSR